MTYRTTIGWSVLSSGTVTLLIGFLPGNDLFWGGLLVLAGIVILTLRD